MKDSKLIDSSVWLEYFYNKTYSEIINRDNELLLLSVLSLFEIKKKLEKDKLSSSNIKKCMDFVKKRSLIINLTKEIAEKAVEISLKYSLASIDSFIYTTAILNNAKVITMDNDFRNIENVEILAPTK